MAGARLLIISVVVVVAMTSRHALASPCVINGNHAACLQQGWSVIESTANLVLFRRVSAVNQSDFSGLSSLHSLTLTHSQIAHIPSRAFVHLTSLRTLAINHHDSMAFETDSFFGLSALDTLDLEHNELKSIPSLVGLDNLHHLHLSSNPIVSLTAKDFEGVTTLSNVYMENTQLKTIDEDALANQTSLLSVVLSIQGHPSLETKCDLIGLLGNYPHIQIVIPPALSASLKSAPATQCQSASGTTPFTSSTMASTISAPPAHSIPPTPKTPSVVRSVATVEGQKQETASQTSQPPTNGTIPTAKAVSPAHSLSPTPKTPSVAGSVPTVEGQKQETASQTSQPLTNGTIPTAKAVSPAHSLQPTPVTPRVNDTSADGDGVAMVQGQKQGTGSQLAQPFTNSTTASAQAWSTKDALPVTSSSLAGVGGAAQGKQTTPSTQASNSGVSTPPTSSKPAPLGTSRAQRVTAGQNFTGASLSPQDVAVSRGKQLSPIVIACASGFALACAALLVVFARKIAGCRRSSSNAPAHGVVNPSAQKTQGSWGKQRHYTWSPCSESKLPDPDSRIPRTPGSGLSFPGQKFETFDANGNESLAKHFHKFCLSKPGKSKLYSSPEPSHKPFSVGELVGSRLVSTPDLSDPTSPPYSPLAAFTSKRSRVSGGVRSVMRKSSAYLEEEDEKYDPLRALYNDQLEERYARLRELNLNLVSLISGSFDCSSFEGEEPMQSNPFGDTEDYCANAPVRVDSVAMPQRTEETACTSVEGDASVQSRPYDRTADNYAEAPEKVDSWAMPQNTEDSVSLKTTCTSVEVDASFHSHPSSYTTGTFGQVLEEVDPLAENPLYSLPSTAADLPGAIVEQGKESQLSFQFVQQVEVHYDGQVTAYANTATESELLPGSSG